MLENLMQNPVAQAVLAFCTVFSVGFAIYTWIFGKKNKEISYTVKSFVLVEKKKSTIPKMKLLFDNRQVESLTATTITLWNSGNDAIRREDIVKDKPLILSAPDTVEILDVQVTKQNEKSNHFSVEMVDGTWTIDFDYMDKKEGAVLLVYHTGPADKFALDCKIIGGKPPRQLRLSKDEIDTVLIFSIVMAFFAAALDLFIVDAIVSGNAAGVFRDATAVAIAAAAVVAGVAAGAATAVDVAAAAVLDPIIVAVAAVAGAVAVAADVVANIADLFPYFAVPFACTALIFLILRRTQNISFTRIPDSLQ